MEAKTPYEADVQHLRVRDRVDRVFGKQRQNRHNIGRTTAAERIDKLKRLAQVVEENQGRIQRAIYDDFRKPPVEVDLTEIYVTLAEIRHAIMHLKSWMKPKRVGRTLAMATTRSWIRYEPKGMVLILAPWNFPLQLAMAPVISAIAAGNCIMVKPSEISMNTSQLIQEILESVFPETEVAVFQGDKAVAQTLLEKPFDHIFFTGSTEVGKIVMRAAADHLASVTLELGGKSPAIVDETADIADAAAKIAWGKYVNAGQTCIAPDYLLVQQSIAPDLIEALKERIRKFYGETDEDRRASPDYARIIDDRHHQRLQGLLQESLTSGAHVEIGGGTEGGDRFVAPTILSGVGPYSAIMQEEIFGPILPIITWRELEEALEFVRLREKPLALYIFSKDKSRIERILAETRAGGTCINDNVIQFVHLNLPFGGANQSGIGNSHGFFGFRAMSHERAVLKQGRIAPMKLSYPPYNWVARRAVAFTKRFL